MNVLKKIGKYIIAFFGGVITALVVGWGAGRISYREGIHRSNPNSGKIEDGLTNIGDRIKGSEGRIRESQNDIQRIRKILEDANRRTKNTKHPN